MSWTVPDTPPYDEPFVGDERVMLDGFLELRRMTFLRVCRNLTGAQLALQAAPPSALSLMGLARHLTDVERTWLRRRFGAQDIPPLYARPEQPDAAFIELDPAQAEAAFAALAEEWQQCRAAVAGAALDATFTHARWGAMSLRWIYLHLLSEYATHTGHAQLLRERIDGVTGF
jgi:hypothetical protein